MWVVVAYNKNNAARPISGAKNRSANTNPRIPKFITKNTTRNTSGAIKMARAEIDSMP
jgi:hypothetical protein